MSEQIVVVTEPEPEPEAESIDRTLGRLEAETEQLAEEVQEAAEQAEQAAETAWDSRAEVLRLREDLPGMIREIVESVIEESEAEDGQENSTEEIELPAETIAEPVPEVRAKRLPDWLI